jgi:hypothetical protein
MVHKTGGYWVFRTLSIFRHSNNYRTRRFENWIYFRPHVSGDTPTLLGPLERANMSSFFFGVPDNGQRPKI